MYLVKGMDNIANITVKNAGSNPTNVIILVILPTKPQISACESNIGVMSAEV